jgi:GMP synthase (glutamine-hydrolysing)
MKILIIDNGAKHLGKLKDLLRENEIEIYPLFSKYPRAENYDLVILSGGGQLSIVTNPEIFTEEINLIKKCKVPIIGICEGCEIIAYAFGSRLEFNKPKNKGVKKIEMVNHDFVNIIGPIEVYEAHFWAIKETGEYLTGIAKSERGWEIIKHKDRCIYGLQFHPEMFVDKTQGDEIFKKIVNNLIKEKQEINIGKSTLNNGIK